MAADAIALDGRPRLTTGPATAEVIDRFRAALAARGIVPPECIIADGSIHRCDAAGKNGKGDAVCLLQLDGIPAGGAVTHTGTGLTQPPYQYRVQVR
jgi:phage/plasmid primase-like uncharacterized protein